MPIVRINYLFYRYIDELATEEETAELMELLSKDENGPALLALMEEAWQTYTPGSKRIDKTRGLEMLDAILSAANPAAANPAAAGAVDTGNTATPLKSAAANQRTATIQSAAIGHPATPHPATPGKATITRLRPWTRVAAAAVLIIAVTLVYQRLRQTPETIAQATPPAKPATQTLAKDFTRQYRLPDGSTVTLRAGGHLDFPAAFGEQSREVSLSGEAFFNIATDARRPFIIHTGGISTTVLGTAFDIRASTEQVVVSVTQGKVKVEKGTKLLAVLLPNHQVTYTIPSDLAKEQKVDANAVVTDWAKEDMVFDQTAFGDIATLLNRRYGVTIQFKNPDIRSCKLKAYFNGTETLEKVLEQLCTISNAKYTRDSENQFIIDGPGCS